MEVPSYGHGGIGWTPTGSRHLVVLAGGEEPRLGVSTYGVLAGGEEPITWSRITWLEALDVCIYGTL